MTVLPNKEAWDIFNTAEQICSAVVVSNAVARLAGEISAVLKDQSPLVLSVMGGAVVFTGQLLPQLNFPLDFDYIHVSRYGNETKGRDLDWKVFPSEHVQGRTVLVIDDILDEGQTMASIRDKVMALQAAKFYCAVFADKEIGRPKPIQADFTGVKLPDRFVFGFGMDIYGAWRNLPAIYAVKN